MADIQLLSESMIKVEEVKTEPDDNVESKWNSSELREPSILESLLKRHDDAEGDELKPVFAVFLLPNKKQQEESQEGGQDPLASCDEDIFQVRVKQEQDLLIHGGDVQRVTELPQGSSMDDSMCSCLSIGRETFVLSLTPSGVTPKQCPTSSEYECSVCMKSTSWKRTMLMHKRILNGEKQHPCSVCKKSFKRNQHLIQHMRIHTGEEPYPCSVCKKSFKRQHHLVYHLRIHSGERPFKCAICRKGFIGKQPLDIHMKSHTNEKPYECSACKKKFKSKSYVKIHMLSHSGERQFECTVCKKSFVSKSNLNIHMRSHSDEKPLKCSVFRKSFVRRNQLVKHNHC